MKSARRFKAAIVDKNDKNIDYRRVVTMPIHDMWNDGRIVFLVDVYGVEPGDLSIIPGGSEPMIKAVERLGLDPMRYQAWLWDIGVKRK